MVPPSGAPAGSACTRPGETPCSNCQRQEAGRATEP